MSSQKDQTKAKDKEIAELKEKVAGLEVELKETKAKVPTPVEPGLHPLDERHPDKQGHPGLQY